ncbi:MAG: efflux RND transporter permease subunit [Bacteroidota bacterium]
MWLRIADAIIQFRTLLLAVILVITAFMGYHASRVEMSYDFNQTVPPEDPDMVFLKNFRKQFGEDGNVIAIGMKDSALFTLANFNRFELFCNKARQVDGVNEVLSLPRVRILVKDTAQDRFRLDPLFPESVTSQQSLDSLMEVFRGQRFYAGQLVNDRNGAAMMLVSVQREFITSAKRVGLTNSLLTLGEEFTKDTGINLHFAGLPFIRTQVAEQVRKELSFFLYLSALVTGIIMLLFFRSIRAVLFSLFMIGIVVVWTLGSLALFGFRITMLSGLIPPVIVTIGITNAIYLLNKYHVEFSRHANKMEAIRVVVQKMGLATFLTNLTVAIGFLTLLATDIPVLREFGIVAGLNIIVLFVVSLVMIPGILTWMPEPSAKHLKHLNFKRLASFVKSIGSLVSYDRKAIYVSSIVLAVLSTIGMLQLNSVSFMVDDIPEESQIKRDLRFFEENFSGIMPLELVVELQTKRRRPLLDVKSIQAIDRFESSLDSVNVLSRPISLISFIKASKQGFYNNNPDRYDLPSRQEAGFIMRYMKGQSDNSGLFRSFVDSTFSKMRISMQMADIGSDRMDSLIRNFIQPRSEQLVAELKENLKSETDSASVGITGSSKIFIKGNSFLINNLTESLVLACILITLSMAFLFANVRMILISLIPNLLALMITAGLMGYFGIPLKASTALIFSITFGISVDNSIRFLAKYRQELLANGYFVPRAVAESIHETGKSIVYTSVVLFAGFIIFAFSDFGGTVALGLLTSTTLVISMFTNLILLPALILTFDNPAKGESGHSMIDDLDSNFYGEEEDEAIDPSRIRIHDRGAAE